MTQKIKFTVRPFRSHFISFTETVEPALHIETKENAIEYKKDFIDYVQGILDTNPEETLTALEIVDSHLLNMIVHYETKREFLKDLFDLNDSEEFSLEMTNIKRLEIS